MSGVRTAQLNVPSGTSTRPLEASEEYGLMPDARSTGQPRRHLDRKARCPDPGSQPLTAHSDK